MQRHLLLFLVLVIVAFPACAKREPDAPPVAGLSVRLDRSTVAAGTPFNATYTFTVASNAPAFADDYTVFVHFLSGGDEQIWTDDHQPPTPTRQWKPGQTIEYTRTTFVPAAVEAHAVAIVAGLYSPKDGTRLPLSGDDAGMRSYRVGWIDVRREPEPIPVTFGSGWYDPESSEDRMLEWRWSQGDATLAFRNPRRDVDVLLELDQAADAFPQGQRVEIRLGGEVVDAFTLTYGGREIRRIPLAEARLGEGETVELTLSVDKTFVPASLPQARNADPRQLGVRVFRAYVEPK